MGDVKEVELTFFALIQRDSLPMETLKHYHIPQSQRNPRHPHPAQPELTANFSNTVCITSSHSLASSLPQCHSVERSSSDPSKLILAKESARQPISCLTPNPTDHLLQDVPLKSPHRGRGSSHPVHGEWDLLHLCLDDYLTATGTGRHDCHHHQEGPGLAQQIRTIPP